jgi:hypothetical protein
MEKLLSKLIEKQHIKNILREHLDKLYNYNKVFTHEIKRPFNENNAEITFWYLDPNGGNLKEVQDYKLTLESKTFTIPLEHISYIYYINEWISSDLPKVVLPNVSVAHYTIKDIKSFNIGNFCEQTDPCSHHIVIEFIDNFKVTGEMYGNDIRKLQLLIGIDDKHFSQYDRYSIALVNKSSCITCQLL